jgi:hypothetical protein
MANATRDEDLKSTSCKQARTVAFFFGPVKEAAQGRA